MYRDEHGCRVKVVTYGFIRGCESAEPEHKRGRCAPRCRPEFPSCTPRAGAPSLAAVSLLWIVAGARSQFLMFFFCDETENRVEISHEGHSYDKTLADM
jgi:hypothetical protein